MKEHQKIDNQKAGAKAPGKKLSKAVIAVGVGIGLIIAPGTLTAWQDSKSIVSQERTITAGKLALQASCASGSWALNGVASADISAVQLVPGDVVACSGAEAPRVVCDSLTGFMYFAGVDKVAGPLSGSPAASLSWKVDGTQEAKKLTSTDHQADQAVEFMVSMAPLGDPVYRSDPGAGMALTLDLSAVRVVVSMVAPADNETLFPGEEADADPAIAWLAMDRSVQETLFCGLAKNHRAGFGRSE